ncbi:response regulator [Microbacterium sp.]|uniref:response regulator n=1 Tax=Microbacterium sp. TaxID=51671 RepID=UPI0039E3461E
MSVRVLIVDDNSLVRAGLSAVLASDPGIEVVGEAASGPEALVRLGEAEAHVVLMDIEMPGGNGIAATAQVHRLFPTTRVLMLTMFDLDEYVADALRAGAAGFLLKTTEPEDLVAAVKDCAAGATTLSPRVLEMLVDSFTARPEPVPEPPGYRELTEREHDVLRSLAQGRSNAEIAAHLHMAETTVKSHVAHVLLKLGVRDRVQAAVLAHRARLVDS